MASVGVVSGNVTATVSIGEPVRAPTIDTSKGKPTPDEVRAESAPPRQRPDRPNPFKNKPHFYDPAPQKPLV